MWLCWILSVPIGGVDGENAESMTVGPLFEGVVVPGESRELLLLRWRVQRPKNWYRPFTTQEMVALEPYWARRSSRRQRELSVNEPVAVPLVEDRRGLRWCHRCHAPEMLRTFLRIGAVGKVGLIEGDGDLVEGGAVDIGQ